MRLDMVVKLTDFYRICCGDGQTDLNVSWLDVLWTDVWWTGRFVSGRFWARQSVTRRFVGLPMKILPHMPYALR